MLSRNSRERGLVQTKQPDSLPSLHIICLMTFCTDKLPSIMKSFRAPTLLLIFMSRNLIINHLLVPTWFSASPDITCNGTEEWIDLIAIWTSVNKFIASIIWLIQHNSQLLNSTGLKFIWLQGTVDTFHEVLQTTQNQALWTLLFHGKYYYGIHSSMIKLSWRLCFAHHPLWNSYSRRQMKQIGLQLTVLYE